MKSRIYMCVGIFVLMVSFTQAYLIQGLDLDVDYWAGSGQNECIIVVDWNNTNGPYNSDYHAFGYAWEIGSNAVLADALADIDTAGELDITYDYEWGYVALIDYDQTGIDGDNHTSDDYYGWWWIGSTADAGQTWIAGNGITSDELYTGSIWGLNIDEGDWTSASMSIPEPATMLLLSCGWILARKRK